MLLVGIVGRKRSGKDTVAEILVRDFGFTADRLAAPLKQMLATFYRSVGLDEETIVRKLEGDLKQVPCPFLCGRTPRHAMQTLGTEWGRDQISVDLWVEALRTRLTRLLKVVVPDVRYHNECTAIVSAGGKIIRVDASRRVALDEFSNHTSEREVDELPVDLELDNNGTLFELTHAVRAAMGRIMSP